MDTLTLILIFIALINSSLVYISLEVREIYKTINRYNNISKKNIINEFYNDVCEEAEKNMLLTGKLEGSHYAAMKKIIEKIKTEQ